MFFSCSVEEAEAQAALIGLQALAKVYKGAVVLEMDCKAVTDELKSETSSRSPYYGLVRDVKEALSVFASHKI